MDSSQFVVTLAYTDTDGVPHEVALDVIAEVPGDACDSALASAGVSRRQLLWISARDISAVWPSYGWHRL
uniref:Uncharacterized protein n=1 Tax=viral metagenome TaxID=1070528 RepID=A0A6M3MGV0_9ZZZZ